MSPSPSFFHQEIVARFHELLRAWVRKHDLGKTGLAPLDMILTPHWVVQPDVFFVSKDRLGIIQDRLKGAADLVAEVTDDKRLAKPERKRLQIEHAAHASPRAKMLKLADKCSNLTAILGSPPPDWPLLRRQEYFEWAHAVVAGCRGVNPRLEAQFDALYARRGDLALAMTEANV